MASIERVVRTYDLFPQSVTRHRSAWKVVTDRGVFAFKKSTQSLEQLSFVRFQMESLIQKGFNHALPLLPNRFGEYFVPFEQGYLYCTPWVEGKTGETMRQEPGWVNEVIPILARMHHLSAGVRAGQGNDLKMAGEALLKGWNQRLDEVYRFREIASERIYPSPVDVVFLNHADAIIQYGEEAVRRLQRWLEQIPEREEMQLVFCHGRINPYHVITGEIPVLVNFDRANLDFPSRDLSYLIRYQSLFHPVSPQQTAEWIQLYQTHHPLSQADVELMEVTFLFPHEILQFLHTYYRQESTRKYPEMTLVKRFERWLASHYELNHYG